MKLTIKMLKEIIISNEANNREEIMSQMLKMKKNVM